MQNEGWSLWNHYLWIYMTFHLYPVNEGLLNHVQAFLNKLCNYLCRKTWCHNYFHSLKYEYCVCSVIGYGSSFWSFSIILPHWQDFWWYLNWYTFLKSTYIFFNVRANTGEHQDFRNCIFITGKPRQLQSPCSVSTID